MPPVTGVKDAEARFYIIYDRTYYTVLRYISSRYSRQDEVPDIMQEIYMELFKVLKSKPEGYIKDTDAFVMNLAKKKLSRHYTLGERLKQLIPLHKDDDNADVLDEYGDFEFEDELIDQIMLEEVWRIILCADEMTKKIFHMRYIDNLSLDTVSERLNVPLHTVRNKLYRTTEDIKRHFEKVAKR